MKSLLGVVCAVCLMASPADAGWLLGASNKTVVKHYHSPVVAVMPSQSFSVAPVYAEDVPVLVRSSKVTTKTKHKHRRGRSTVTSVQRSY